MGFAKGTWKFNKKTYKKNLNKNNTKEMEVPNARGVVKNLDYPVYHYSRPTWPLCLGNSKLVC